MTARAYDLGEVAAQGQAIYREQIQPNINLVAKGNFVVIDVNTGDYEIDSDDAEATCRLLVRNPEAVTYGIRVGHRAAYSHVGGFRTPGRQ